MRVRMLLSSLTIKLLYHTLDLQSEPGGRLLLTVRDAPPEVHGLLDEGAVVLSTLLLIINSSKDLV
jgi:hypothetical protein